MRVFTLALGISASSWLPKADDTVRVSGGGLQTLKCITNPDDTTMPANSYHFKFGAHATNQQTDTEETTVMSEFKTSLQYKFGFSAITSIEMDASFTSRTEHKTVHTSVRTSEAYFEDSYDFPAIPPHGSQCAYQVISPAWQYLSASQNILMEFNNIIVTSNPNLRLENPGVTIVGKKQRWDARDGYMVWTQRWGGDLSRGWFWYVKDGSAGQGLGWQGDPGTAGHLKLTRRSDDTYLISSVKWPDWYLYRVTRKCATCQAEVQSWQGDPGDQGHWIITAHPYKNCYLLSTTHWRHYYMYMAESNMGRASMRFHEGYPGDEGCWDLTPAFTTLALNNTALAANTSSENVPDDALADIPEMNTTPTLV